MITNGGYILLLMLYWSIVTITYPSLALYLLGLSIFFFKARGLNPLSFLPLCLIPYILNPNTDYSLSVTPILMIVAFLGIAYPSLLYITKTVIKEPKPISYPWFLFATSMAYCLTIVATCTRMHQSFQTGQWDLAVFDNIFYNMISGNGMANPLERTRNDINHLYVHFSPSLFLLAPLYHLAPRAETLPAIQSLMIPIGAISIYYTGKKLVNANVGLIVALCWIFYTPMQGGLFFHFHEIAFAPALLLCMGATMVNNFKVAPWMMLFIMLGIKEDFGIIAVPAILLFGHWSNRWKEATAMSIISIIYIASIKILWTIPYGENWTVYYTNLGVEGIGSFIKIALLSPSTIIENGLYAEKNFRGLIEVLTPLALLSIFTPWGFMLLVGPSMILYSAQHTPLAYNHMQYTFYIAGFVFLGLLEALRNTNHLRAKLLLILIATILCQWSFGIINPNNIIISGGDRFNVPHRVTNPAKYKELRVIIKDWDKNTVVMAENTITPHISNRPRAYSIEIANMQEEDWQQKKSMGKRYSELPIEERPDKIITHRGSPMNNLVDFELYQKDKETEYFTIYSRKRDKHFLE
jgi:uncharacterized membrane protein